MAVSTFVSLCIYLSKGRKTKSTHQTMIDAEPDMISNLPGHVIDEILSHLPIREAVRTSVLSKIWKNQWYTLPNLVFDRDFVFRWSPGPDPLLIESKFIEFVDYVLLLHSGPINMFKLSEDCISENFRVGIDRWILHLIGRSIKKFELEYWVDEKEDRYKIPRCLFSCQSLHHLKLDNCLLQPPMIFEGFKNLKSLDLEYVTVAQDAFENLITGCPMLEKLKLEEVDGLTQINIHAPNLKIFEIFGFATGISFNNTFQLVTVIIDLCWECYGYYPENNQSTLGGDSNSFLKFFNHLPRIQSLVTDSYILECLIADVLPVKLPTPFIHLSHLSVRIQFDELKEIAAALCLLKSSPNLQKLEISAPIVQDTVNDTYCWEDTFSRPDTPIQLRHVTIDRIFGFQHDLDFIRFLLLYSPKLEKMVVKDYVRPELVAKLNRFKRASEEVEITYRVYNY